ncbi:MAG: hypothetical protein AB7V14_01485 [Kiritimatiellia bacterium]
MWKKKQERPGRPFSVGRTLWALAWQLALALLLLYGLLHVWVRTDFFRARVERELSRRTGMEIRVGRIRATESLNLRIRDAISVSEDAGVEARLIRIRWRLFRPRGTPMLESIRVDGLSLTFAPDAEGNLQPSFVREFSEKTLAWTGVALDKEAAPPAVAVEEKARAAPAPGGSIPRISLRKASVRWQDAQGRLLASMSGLELDWTTMELPGGGRVGHLDARAAEVKVAKGPKIAGLHLELVDTGGRQYLVALDAADWGSAQKPRSKEAEYRNLLDATE